VAKSRPVIGITTYVTSAKWGYWELEAALIPADYVRAVERAGGRPLLVPPAEEGVDETLEVLDGIVFSGGSDIDPELYGDEPHPETLGVHPERDAAELDLLTAALDRDMPVLGICRGSQVLNIARGGDLYQHLPEVVGHEEHKHEPGDFADHDVVIEGGTRLAELLGEETTGVKSHHHQGFRRGGGRSVEAVRARRALASRGGREHPPVRGARARGGAVRGQPVASRLGGGRTSELGERSGVRAPSRRWASIGPGTSF
jgi:gamma-glutamyl-gamma-aminobutyrate hydrolase PuuD